VLDNLAGSGRLNINSLKHAKSFLSGVFRLALQLDFYAGSNPVQQTSIPKGRPASDTYAYSLEEIDQMFSVLPEPAATIIATAGYTGARRGELSGISWENYNGGEILISKSVWQGHITDPKSTKSKAAIPIIKRLADRLEFHRARLGNPESGPMFPNEAGKPMDLNNLLCRAILPALRKANIEWHGWHAFRRGLATNLYRLGVPDKTIQMILRHANVSTTQTCYIKTVGNDAKLAMDKLQFALSDSDRPVESAVPISTRTM
jgi:integrase